MPVKSFAVTNVNHPQPDMENNNEDRNSEQNKHDVMVSNLPLLFSDGNPTSLDVMTVVSEPSSSQPLISLHGFYVICRRISNILCPF
jgi:hypothetical protein